MAEVIGEQVQFGAAFGSATILGSAVPQGSTFAKVDTRLLIDTATSATADASQYAADLSSTSGGAYEATSARLALDQPRSIEVSINARDTTDGTILALTDTSGDGAYRLMLDGAGNLEVFFDTATQMTIALPGVSSSTDTYFVSWSTVLDPDQDVAADGTRWLQVVTIYNSSAPEWSVTHEAFGGIGAADAADAFAYGGYWDGAALADAFTGAINTIRIGCRFHTSTEFREDWVQQSTAPTFAGDVLDPIMPPPTTAADGNFAGWDVAYLAAVSRQCAQRSLGALVNLVCNSAPTLSNAYTPVNRWADTSLGGVIYMVNRGLVWNRPIPIMANRVRVSVHLQVWDNAGSADRSVDVALVSSSHSPGSLQFVGGGQIVKYWATGNRTTDDTSTGMGGWVTMSADVRIAADDDRWSWFYLAFRCTDSDARWKVHAVSVDAVAYSPEGSFQIQIGP